MTDSDFADSVREFNAQAACERRAIWGCRVQLAGGLAVCVSKGATKIQRVPQEQGGGWVHEARAQFDFPASLAFTPEIGSQWTILEYPDCPSEVGTVWRCIDLSRAEVGADHVLTCKRMDN